MSSTSTRAFYGCYFDSTSRYGGGAPPWFDGLTTYEGDFISSFSALKALGARTMWKVVGGPDLYKGVNSEFSLAMWKNRVDIAAAKTSAQQMNNFYLDGTLAGIVMIDDHQKGTSIFPGGIPSGADLDEMARYQKSYWSMVPAALRGDNIYCRTIAPGGSFKTVDYNICQIDSYPSQGPVMKWAQNNINDGKACGLGTVLGINLLNAGSGVTPWTQHPGRANKFGMSPQEIEEAGQTYSALQADLIGFSVWARRQTDGTGTYYELPEIQTAMTNVANRIIGQTQGPLNYHGATSSVSTVVGHWSYRASPSGYRTGAAASLVLAAPSTITTGALSCILAQSRDSNERNPVLPSGWSLGNSISGNSAQGGALALFYKIASGTELNQTITFAGTGGATGAVQAEWFCFSGNTQNMAGLKGTAGSVKSWSHGTSSMGPVKGLTPASVGQLVLCCVAKVNDFGAGNLVPDGTISATTNDGETWNRAFAVNNLSGDDQGMFVDYTFLTGAQSITTKSWSQLTQANSGSSGAGCGFMVSFLPALIQTGTPPSLTRLEDVAMSVGSTLSFAMSSTGSTPITYSLTSAPSTVTLTSAGTFQYTPAAAGAYVVDIQALNSFGTDVDEFVISVSATAGGPSSNNTPVITNPGNMTIRAQEQTSFVVVATDADGDVITYGLDASAPSGTFIDQDTGQFIWTPTGEQGPGVYPMVVSASDGQATSRSTFTITVSDTPWTRVGGPTTQFGRSSQVGNSFRRI